MHARRLNLTLGFGVLLAIALACNFSASTANISSLKVSSDEDGAVAKDTFGPGDVVYCVAEIANNPGKVQAKFRVLYDDVKGETAGTLIPGAEKTLDVDGSRAAKFWITLPAGGFQNGRYKCDVAMLNDKGEQKDQKSATFNVKNFAEK